MDDKLRFLVKINGNPPSETVLADSNQQAAEKFLARIARRDLGSRAYKPRVVSEGTTDSGAKWWKGELVRRARDGNGWVSANYQAIFTTREKGT